MFESKCGCGGIIAFAITKPTRMTPTISRANCKECGSRYIFSCRVDLDKPGRILKIDSDALEITPKLTEILTAKRQNESTKEA